MNNLIKKTLSVGMAAALLLVPFANGVVANAEGKFEVKESEITVEKGQVINLTYENAVGDIVVGINNETDSKLWEKVYKPNDDGVLSVEVPSDNPLLLVYLHVFNNDVEEVVKVSLVIPHEHSPHVVEFIRPTETEAGRMEYYTCDCGKAFEDRACTKEIQNPDEWAYLAPVPKEEWGNAPVAPVDRFDSLQVTDESKPNPSWKEEDVTKYYEEEAVKEQEILKERANTATNKTEKNEETLLTDKVVEGEAFEEQDGDVVAISTTMALDTPAADVQAIPDESLTFWEKVKRFFEKVFNI